MIEALGVTILTILIQVLLKRLIPLILRVTIRKCYFTIRKCCFTIKENAILLLKKINFTIKKCHFTIENAI